MIPYYILQSCDSKISDDYYSANQSSVSGVKDSDERFFYKFTNEVSIDAVKFRKYDLSCEFEFNRKGRAYAVDDYFEKYYLIEEKCFYFCPSSQILILNVGKEVFHRFCKEFEPKHHSNPPFIKVDVDFEKIVNNQHSLGIEGIWFGQYPDQNINGSYFHGTKIETSETYHELLNKGANIKNITIIYKFNNKQEKIMITKEGGIITYEHNDIVEALPLILDTYNNLLTA